MTRVERLWPGETFVCIGTGPSLTQAQVDACAGRARVIVINNAYTYAPWADVMYACDRKFWNWPVGLKAAAEFGGLKYSLQDGVPAGVQVLKNLGKDGLSRDPAGLKTGHNSGYQAINLAVLLGARRVILLGYDMHGGHCFGQHPDKSGPPFALCLAAFPTLVEPLRQAGVSVINCTPGSALLCFPMASLADALQEIAA